MSKSINSQDKIFQMFKAYKDLLTTHAKETNDLIYGIDQMASRLVIAHLLDDVSVRIKDAGSNG